LPPLRVAAMVRSRAWLLGCCAVLVALLALVVVPMSVQAVDRNKFRTCRQSAFCQRQRQTNEGAKRMQYVAQRESAVWDAPSATLTLPLSSTTFPGQPPLDAKIQVLHDGIIRFTAQEQAPLHPRHHVDDVVQEAASRPFAGVIEYTPSAEQLQASWSAPGRGESYAYGVAPALHKYAMSVQLSPFSLRFTVDDVVVLQANSEGLLHFEQYRARNDRPQPPQLPQPPTPVEGETPEQAEQAQADYQSQLAKHAVDQALYDAAQAQQTWPFDEAGMWEETHGSHIDVKQRGPAAVGLDVTFLNAQHAYGIPEHASSFSLKNTVARPSGGDEPAQYAEPFRLYNLDVFEYELDEPMALYGAVPYVASHTVDGKFSTGVLWLNSAETYVDMSTTQTSSGLFGGGAAGPNKRVHWMSESGRLDAFFVLGPKPSDLFLQYTALTGFPFLPPQFSIGYHQCRWNYKSSEDVLAVSGGFDTHDMPVDVLWLDIEHTDAKKYFTWDRASFPDPAAMQRALADKGRRLVTIVDPHIKRDNNYHVHQEATAASHYVKNKAGSDYEGWCWPGSSAYLDFFQQRVRDFWADLFSLRRYADSTLSLFVWNDMNEPSVFNGPEVTMPKDNLHQLDGRQERTEHRDVHNQYGMYVHMATAQGLVQRGENKQRPFVLTRAFFAGSQRSAAVWTGDNTATWGHLKIAQPMLLSLAVGQIPFSGSDVGGFFGDPDAQLLTRWYQAAAYHPFFRGHAHIDTKRREPWLFGEPYTSLIRAALRTRYANLPYLYTLFYLNTQTGMPILRPLWVEFPEDQGAHGVDESFLLGPALLVQPVVEPDQQTSVVRLPGKDTLWYDLQSDAKHSGQSSVNVLTPLQHIPVFQRGGSIVARRERARRSSPLMAHDPYTLVVALDSNGEAQGQLFLDDTNSYAYQRGGFLLLRFTLSSAGVLRGELQAGGEFEDRNVIERVVLLGAENRFTQATLVEGTDAQGQSIKAQQPLQVQAANGGKRIILRKPDVRIGSPFAIKLQ